MLPDTFVGFHVCPCLGGSAAGVKPGTWSPDLLVAPDSGRSASFPGGARPRSIAAWLDEGGFSSCSPHSGRSQRAQKLSEEGSFYAKCCGSKSSEFSQAQVLSLLLAVIRITR